MLDLDGILLKNSKLLLDIVKTSITEELDNSSLIDKNYLFAEHVFLEAKRATFVTLNIDGNLRGCMGSLMPHRTILEDIISNAKAAAFEDPRFPALSKSEFPNLDIEISILTIPKLLEYKDVTDLKSKIDKGTHGVILKQDMQQATFLPQVWEQLPAFEYFFSHLCQKAGLGFDCLINHPEIYVYKALKIKE